MGYVVFVDVETPKLDGDDGLQPVLRWLSPYNLDFIVVRRLVVSSFVPPSQLSFSNPLFGNPLHLEVVGV